MKRLILFFTLLPFFFIGCVSTDKYSQLKKDKLSIQSKYEKLNSRTETKYSEMEHKYNILLYKYNALQKKHDDSKQTANLYYKRAIEFFEKKKYAKAITNFKYVINKYPEDPLVKHSKLKLSAIEKIAMANYNLVLTEINSKKNNIDKILIIKSSIDKLYLTETKIKILSNKLKSYSASMPPIIFVDKKIIHSPKDYDLNRYSSEIDFYVQFRNNSLKEVVGVEYRYTFTDSFDKILHSGSYKFNIRIESQKTNEMNTYLLWKDNEFISNQVYDILNIPVQNKTIKVKVDILKVIFEDSSIWKPKKI